MRPNRFVWLGTTRPFPSFFFSFRQNAHGLWRAHAYQYAEGESTFIVETTDAAWRAAGLEEGDEAATIAYCEALFKEELEGHRLIANRSIWRQFPTVKCRNWSDGRLVLLGDSAHTAHFSVGSGTKLAMEDAIELSRVLQGATDVAAALKTYETERRPGVESVQRAAQASLEWFEATERYDDLEPLQFAYSLLTRSLRITHENLRTRDPAFVERVERWYADKAGVTAGEGEDQSPALPDPVSPAWDAAQQPHRGVADVPVLRRGRGAERLAPAAPRQQGHRRRGAGDDGNDRCERGGTDHPRVHRHLQRRPGGGVEADRGLRARTCARHPDGNAAGARGTEGGNEADVGG